MLNDVVRQLFTEYYQAQFPDRELFDKVLPHYPPFSKRFVRDNGIWARTFAKRRRDARRRARSPRSPRPASAWPTAPSTPST